MNDIDIDVSYFEQYINNSILKNVFKIIINDTFESEKTFIVSTISRIFNNLKTYQTNNGYTISVSTSYSSVATFIKETIISYLNDNKAIENIHVVFKIVHDIDESYLGRIASLIINQKNVFISFPSSSYNKDPYNDVEYFSNGLRIFESLNDNEKRSNGRMIVTSTSINMARLGLKYLNNHSISHFYEELDSLLELTKNQLVLAFETMGNKSKENYQVLFNGNVLGDERLESGQKIRKIIKSGVINIGLVGLLIKILKYIDKKIKQFSDETKLNFQMFEPSGLTSRKHFIGIDKSIYGTHKDITDKNAYELIDTAKFITNNKELSKVQELLSGGCLATINISNKTNNKKIVDQIIELMNNDIGFVKLQVDK